MPLRKAWKSVPKPVRQVISLVIGGTLIVIGGLLIVLPGPFTVPFVFDPERESRVADAF